MGNKPDNVREALDRLFVYNDALHNASPAHLDGSVPVDDTVKDVQDNNYEMLADLADLLGMQELYEPDNSTATIEKSSVISPNNNEADDSGVDDKLDQIIHLLEAGNRIRERCQL